jgi:hypothetical protein
VSGLFPISFLIADEFRYFCGGRLTTFTAFRQQCNRYTSRSRLLLRDYHLRTREVQLIRTESVTNDMSNEPSKMQKPKKDQPETVWISSKARIYASTPGSDVYTSFLPLTQRTGQNSQKSKRTMTRSNLDALQSQDMTNHRKAAGHSCMDRSFKAELRRS